MPDEFRVGILGRNPFGDALGPLKGKQVNGRTIVVNELKPDERLDSYHLLFISASEHARLAEILSQGALWHALDDL